MLGKKILYVREKKFYHQITRVILSHNPNHPPPPPSLKSQMVDPLIECNYMQNCATESWLFVGS